MFGSLTFYFLLFQFSNICCEVDLMTIIKKFLVQVGLVDDF